MFISLHIPLRHMHYTHRFLTYRLFTTNTIIKQLTDIKLAGHYLYRPSESSTTPSPWSSTHPSYTPAKKLRTAGTTRE